MTLARSRKRRVVVAAAAAIACLNALVVGPAGHAQGDGSVAAWSVRCEQFVMHDDIDPIMNWGGSSLHVHTFTGSTGVNNQSYPDQLRSYGTNTCMGPPVFNASGQIPDPNVHYQDNSAYWIPALYPNEAKTLGQEINPYTTLIYYRNALVLPQTIGAIPKDLSIIAGEAKTPGEQNNQTVIWSCVSDKMNHQSVEPNFRQQIPDWCPVDTGYPDYAPFYLRLVVKFPNCILPPPSEQHQQLQVLPPAAYAAPAGGQVREAYAVWTSPQPHSAKSCTPYGASWLPIPQVQMGFRWPLSTSVASQFTKAGVGLAYDLTHFTLASDHTPIDGGGYSGTHGMTAHADFMNGWDPAVLAALMHNCYGQGTGGTIQNCGVIGGDGS